MVRSSKFQKPSSNWGGEALLEDERRDENPSAGQGSTAVFVVTAFLNFA